MPAPPCGGELRRSLVLERTVWAGLVVIHAPRGDDRPGFRQRAKSVFVQVLVAELAIEAFNIGVLCWLARPGSAAA